MTFQTVHAEPNSPHGMTRIDPDREVTWVIVTNGCRARIYETDGPGRGIRPALTQDLYGDCATADDPSSTVRRTFDRSTPPHAVTAQKLAFARTMARRIDDSLSAGRFHRLILVAPPQTLGDLRGALSSMARARVKCEISRDLTNVAGFELADYLGPALTA